MRSTCSDVFVCMLMHVHVCVCVCMCFYLIYDAFACCCCCCCLSKLLKNHAGVNPRNLILNCILCFFLPLFLQNKWKFSPPLLLCAAAAVVCCYRYTKYKEKIQQHLKCIFLAFCCFRCCSHLICNWFCYALPMLLLLLLLPLSQLLLMHSQRKQNTF